MDKTIDLFPDPPADIEGLNVAGGGRSTLGMPWMVEVYADGSQKIIGF